MPTHMPFASVKKELYEKTLFHELYLADQELKPIFYITGNNDSLTGNYQPFEVDGKSPLTFATDWNDACAHCDGLIIDGTHMRHDGYYSSYVIPNNKELVLIALNTIQWTKTPFYAANYPHQDEDAEAQLLWLAEQLRQHHSKQLLIAMHVPPGRTYNGSELWHKIYLQQFIQLLEQYHRFYGQITLLTSHTHMDEFRKIKLKDGTNIFAYATPGISRLHHNNPGLKMFELDEQLKIKNFVTYYTSKLNAWNQESYQALGAADAIFPKCVQLNLAQCLDVYTDEQICTRLDQGLFYGVKSTNIHHNGCTVTYSVN